MNMQLKELNNRIPSLDGIRGVACLLVVLSHSIELYSHSVRYSLIGALGVLIFFSLSGFLIGHLYISSEFNSPNVRKYLISRFSRIVPAYYLAVLIYLIIDFFIQPYYGMGLTNIVRSLLFVSSVGVFWSIGPEIQFYLFFCVIWFYASNFNWFNTKITPLFLFFVLVSLGLVITRNFWPGILLPSKLHIFLFGILSAVIFRYFKKKQIVANIAIPLTLTIGLFATWYVSNVITSKTIFYDLVVSLMVASIIGLLTFPNKLSGFFSGRLIGFIGEASFSIYLFHGPTLRLLDTYGFNLFETTKINLAVAILIAILVPSVFHILVEKKLNVVVKNKMNQIFIKRS